MALFHRPAVRGRDAQAPVAGIVGSMSPARAQEWAQLWFGVQRTAWDSLALVPAARGASTLAAAQAMLEVAQLYHLLSVRLIDATAARPAETAALIARMADSTIPGERTIVALGSPLVSASAIPIARAASAALLVVPLGTARAQDTRATVAAVGREHFVGSVTVRTPAAS